MFFQGDQLDDEIKNIMLYTIGISTDKKSDINMENKDIVNTANYLDDLTGSSQNNLCKHVDHDNNTKNVNLISSSTETQDFKSLDVADISCSEKQIARAYEKNKLV